MDVAAERLTQPSTREGAARGTFAKGNELRRRRPGARAGKEPVWSWGTVRGARVAQEVLLVPSFDRGHHGDSRKEGLSSRIPSREQGLRSDHSPIWVMAHGRTWRHCLTMQVTHVTPAALKRHQVELVVESQCATGPRCSACDSHPGPGPRTPAPTPWPTPTRWPMAAPRSLDEVLDVTYWFQRIITVVLGAVWRVSPWRGFLGIAGPSLICAGVLCPYGSDHLQRDGWHLKKFQVPVVAEKPDAPHTDSGPRKHVAPRFHTDGVSHPQDKDCEFISRSFCIRTRRKHVNPCSPGLSTFLPVA